MTTEGQEYIRTAEFKSVKDAVLAVFQHEAPMAGRAGLNVSETTDALKALTSMTAPIRGKFYYGPISGALSRLAKDGHLVRLVEKRAGHSVYVLPEYIAERPYYAPQPSSSPGPAPVVTGRLTDFQSETYALYTVNWVAEWTDTKAKSKGGNAFEGPDAQEQAEAYITEVEETARQRSNILRLTIHASKTATQRAERIINYGQEVTS